MKTYLVFVIETRYAKDLEIFFQLYMVISNSKARLPALKRTSTLSNTGSSELKDMTSRTQKQSIRTQTHDALPSSNAAAVTHDVPLSGLRTGRHGEKEKGQ